MIKLFLFLAALIFQLVQSITCPPFCSFCSDDTSCNSCNYGYGPNSGSLCQPCSVIGCQQCYTGYLLCQSCGSSYRLVSNTCEPCDDSQCSYCNSNKSVCTYCLSYYGFNETFVCTRCSDSKCGSCNANYTQCSSCMMSYGVNLNTFQCQVCQDIKCQYCNTNFQKCTMCLISSGYGVNLNFSCVPCEQAECQTCLTTNSSRCSSCIDGFGRNFSSDRCVPCGKSDCLRCPTSYLSCQQCNNTFLSGSTCLNCTVSYCQKCTVFRNVCQSCQKGYGVSPSGNCSQCIEQCLDCQPTDYSLCLQCGDGYYLSSSNCLICATNCLLCDDGSSCLLCNETFYLNQNTNICQPCPQNCTKCTWNLTYYGVQCTDCIDFFQPDITEPTPLLCTQKCGDLIRVTFPCDFQLGIQYDGCTDMCGVEDGFICVSESMNNSSSNNSNISSELGSIIFNQEVICSYERIVSLNITKVSREKDKNQILITLSIWPTLHVFKTLGMENVFQISEGFKIMSARYDQSGQVFIQASFGENKVNKTVLILFSPNVSYDSRFFATPQSSTSFSINSLNYYSNFVQIITKIFEIFCFAIVVLCWINGILGLISKRLAGIQSFVACQIVYLSFVWIKSAFYLPFESTWPLQYLSIMKINFKTQTKQKISSYSMNLYNDDISGGGPHINAFDLQQASFLNNFNIGLVFQIVPLLCLLLSSLIGSVLKKKIRDFIEENGDIPYTDEYDESGYAKSRRMLVYVDKSKQFFAQILIFFTTLNIIGFINSATLLFKYQSSPFEMVDIILVSVSSGSFLLTFIIFYLDPDPFDYFRYSFRRLRIALFNYWFLLFAFISTSLMIVLTAPSWAAFIPFTLFCVFTLKYKPFKQLQENYRSALVMFSIVFVLGFRVYLEYFPNHLNNDMTYVYLFIILTVVLIICVSTLVFLIYKFVYTRFILPKMQKDEKEKIMFEIEMMNVNEKIKYDKSGGVFSKIMRNQMSILNFSHQMRNLAIQTRVCDVNVEQHKIQNLSRNQMIGSFWREEPVSGRKLRKQMNENEKINIKKSEKSQRSESMESYLLEYNLQQQKIQQNIKKHLQQYVKNKQEEFKEEQSEPQNQEVKQANEINYALQLVVEENKFLGLKNAEQYTYQKKKEKVKDEEMFLEEYNKICSEGEI